MPIRSTRAIHPIARMQKNTILSEIEYDFSASNLNNAELCKEILVRLDLYADYVLTTDGFSRNTFTTLRSGGFSKDFIRKSLKTSE